MHEEGPVVRIRKRGKGSVRAAFALLRQHRGSLGGIARMP